jgi:hypothetical protein
MAEIDVEARTKLPKLSRMALLAIAAAPLPLLLGWSIYVRQAGLGADAMRLPLIVSIVWGVTFTFLSWRRLDEGGREAIKFAFCWGAGPGMMIAATVVLLVLYYPQPIGETVKRAVEGYAAMRDGALPPETAGFFVGAAMVIGIQQMLFVLVWLVWWARRRLGPQ